MSQSGDSTSATVVMSSLNGDATQLTVLSAKHGSQVARRGGDLPPNSRRYQVLECVGRGGMASVWKAHDREMGREVAIKVALPDKDSEIASEGRMIAQLQHPNIIPVYDLSCSEDGRQFYVMKLLKGRALDELCGPGGLSPIRRIDVVRQVCLATHYAHQRGIVHRDIKPGNIIVGELGEVFLADWGIARDMRQAAEDGIVRGTPGYLAPEQFTGLAPAGAPSADVFALGCTLYFVMTGEKLFPTDVEEMLRAFVRGRPRKMSSQLTSELRGCIERATELDVESRTSSGLELADQLQEYLDEQQNRQARYEHACAMWSAIQDDLQQIDDTWGALRSRHHDSVNGVQGIFARFEREAAELEFQSKLVSAQQAITRVLADAPDLAPASSKLAAIYWQRMLDLEADGKSTEAEYMFRLAEETRPDLVSRWDQNATVVLVGTGGYRVIRAGNHPVRDAQCVASGELPVELKLPRGDYVIEVHEDHRVTLFSAKLARGDERVVAARYFDVPESFVCIGYGDAYFAVQRDPVSVREYLEFLNATPETAEAHVPQLSDGRVYLAQVDGVWALPPVDAEGDAWDLDWPMLLVSYLDATAYAAWWSERHGIATRLPTVPEWEYAARGEFQRDYPWGDYFDPTFCAMRESCRHPLSLTQDTADRSPFGVRHMAGNVANWTSTPVGRRFAYKGASYNSMAQMCLIDTTASALIAERHVHIGFRMVIDLAVPPCVEIVQDATIGVRV